MALNEEVMFEAKIAEDIKEFFNIYDLKDMVSEDEITEALENATQYSKKFRDVHTELRLGMKNEYEKKYPKYEEKVKRLREYVKAAKVRLRGVKEAAEASRKEVQQMDKMEVKEERKASLESEHSFFIAKLERKLTSFDWGLMNDYNEINAGVNFLEGSLDDWYVLNGKLKGLFGDNYEDKFEKRFHEILNCVSDKIEKGKLKVKEILLLHEENTRKNEEERTRIEQEKVSAEQKRLELQEGKLNSERKACAKNLYDEIKLLSTNLSSSCKIELENVGDHQLLELKKNVFHFTSELREILDKITSFSKLVPYCGDDESKKMDELSTLRKNAAAEVTKFSNDLGKLIQEKDISEEKLKSALGLQIELPKFKGYDSDMDIYTFRAEFEKLIEPVVQQKFWPDYLKRNYLSGSALTLVDKIEGINDIWTKLIDSFGNVRLLLQNKISALEKQNGLWKVTGDEKIGMAIATLINMMSELSTLAKKFKLEEELYYGGCFEKILCLLGNNRERKFISKCKTSDAKKPAEWVRLVEFLEKELEVRKRLTILDKSKKCLGIEPKNNFGASSKKVQSSHGNVNTVAESTKNKKCHICDEYGHSVVTNGIGREDVPYYACKKFVEMSADDRRKVLFEKKLCAQCLTPGVRFGEDHKCSKDYACPDNFHKKFKSGLHVLICSHHKESKENLSLLEKYRENIIGKTQNLEKFSKEIKICFSKMVGTISEGRNNAGSTLVSKTGKNKTDVEICDNAIFLLQTISVEGQLMNLFFDSGCGDMVIKKSAVDRLQKLGRAKLEVPGPITLTGVGDQKSVCEHGAYSVRLPLKNGREAILSGLCLDKVTAEFPTYPLEQVTRDLKARCKDQGGEAMSKRLPKMPKKVGGNTDILIGVKYIKYFPELIHMFPTGLAVYKSAFLGSDGSDGVVGGPHPEFTKAERTQKGAHAGKRVYILHTTEQYRTRFSLECEVPLLGDRNRSFLSDVIMLNEQKDPHYDVCICRKQLKSIQNFDQVENAGTEISYRCIDCRNCPECKKCPRLDNVSIQEEAEQSLIDRSVDVDIDRGITTAALPFLTQPDLKLVPNEHVALKIFKAQARKLEKRPDDKISVIQSENKLQQLGFVDFLENLKDDEKAMIIGKLQNYIPWRVVWNEKSLSTSCRLVFDASHIPPGGCSLNSLLAKGINSMNKLIDILIRWTVHKMAFHTDIQKMYNAIFLQSKHWRYQLYLWRDDLDVERPPRPKVIKTLIYGVKPSGNLAERGLRQTAEKTKDLYPRASEIIMKDLYVDDCLSGENSKEEAWSTTDNLKLALEKGGFTLKGFTFSGSDPPEHLSKDGKSVVVGGIIWFPKGDFISINCEELNFARKNRGRKMSSAQGVIPENLTKRDCVGKVAEIFDPLGRVTPLVSGMKLDIHELHSRKLDWDDKIPDDLRKIWASNFELMREIGGIRFSRAVVPSDAANLDIDTIDTGDASKNLICCAIYARFEKKSGGFSCQLIFARSKIVSTDTSVPRKELMAATLNAVTGHVVKLALGDLHKRCWKLTDSQVALHWIGCTRSALKMWVRNRAIEINRLADASLWRYVESKNMCADLGTRKGVRIADVEPQSDWISGREWMRGSVVDFPVKTAADLVLNAVQLQEVRKECVVFDTNGKEGLLGDSAAGLRCDTSKLSEINVGHFTHVTHKRNYKIRYEFSQYLIDPLKFRFRKVVRIFALVILFIRKFISKMRASKNERIGNCTQSAPVIGKPVPDTFQNRGDQYILTTGDNKFRDNFKCVGGLVVYLSDEMITAALQYFYRKATGEIFEFLDKRRYEKISVAKDGILYYSGRILSTQEFGGDPSLCEAALDLAATTFCVPLSDSDSPIARAIVDEIHWHHFDVKHGGVESVLRQVQRNFYIIDGRQLVKSFKKGCKKCRVLGKKAIRVAMGPIQDVNLCIAPAFYNSQVDICGPFNAFSNANKRATIKIWFVVFCCCATGAVDCRLMEDYSSDSFILAFIRFSCRFGYPKQLLPDEGSQLVKGCKNMLIQFSSLQHKLNVEYGVDFKTCPVGAHYMHGKVERKIQQIKKSITKELDKCRLSVVQWETLGLQIANSINNLPIGLGNKSVQIENLDILTPNRLILGRNNDRCPTQPLELIQDHKRIIEANAKIFRAWFNGWLISYVPTLIQRPKWFEDDNEVSVGDVVLFLKSEQEFDLQYQYGIVKSVNKGRDDRVRTIEVEYQNHNEKVKRKTIRGVRDVVMIHPVDELPDYEN